MGFTGSRPPWASPQPTTLAILRQMHPPATRRPASASYQETMLWVAATVCFFGFFRTGEIIVPFSSGFDARVDLSWGDVAIADAGKILWVFLKCFKIDQYGRGTEVFLGTTCVWWRRFMPTWLAVEQCPSRFSAWRVGLHLRSHVL